MAEGFRTERDPLGEAQVPSAAYYGVQTARAVENFPISGLRAPADLVTATIIIKKAAAEANAALGRLDAGVAAAIVAAADEILAGQLRDQFVVDVYQAGAGTSHNMNANEVLANRAAELLGAPRGDYARVHPNDHVNMGQSTNDVFPTATRLALLLGAPQLVAAGRALADSLAAKADAFAHVLKTGRTHLQDAVPITLGQVIDGWVAQIEDALLGVAATLDGLFSVAFGATAVGTGLNAHPKFGETASNYLAKETGQPFRVTSNHVAALSGHDAMAAASGALRTLAAVLMKMANDVRLYSSGPRAGIGELKIPENEPGSSIMPGKINPTQCEAMTMVSVQVFGNDLSVAMANSQGQFQLNVFKPVILHNVLESIDLLADACRSFDLYCARGLEPNLERIRQHVEESLMLVTALNPHIGYEKSAAIALKAHREGGNLRDVAVASGLVSAEDFDRWVRPADMANPRQSH